MKTPSCQIPRSKTLSGDESKIRRALASGHLPSLAKAVVNNNGHRDLVLYLLLEKIDSVCNAMCQQKPNTPSVFQEIPN